MLWKQLSDLERFINFMFYDKNLEYVVIWGSVIIPTHSWNTAS
jgi:hypothetical protein